MRCSVSPLCTRMVNGKLIWLERARQQWALRVEWIALSFLPPRSVDPQRADAQGKPDLDACPNLTCGDRIRVGLTGLSTTARSATAAMFAPCPNITLAARQITQLASNVYFACKRSMYLMSARIRART